MLQLILMMAERVGLIVLLGFMLAHVKKLRMFLQYPAYWNRKLVLVVLFSIFCIVSNYTGIEVLGDRLFHQDWVLKVHPASSIANTRVMGVTIGGLLGGPVVGTAVGLIAGIHRYTLGGITAFSCTISSIMAGLGAGIVGLFIQKKHQFVTPKLAAIVGVLMESIQMVVILIIAKPFEEAWLQVKIIALPMIIVNGTGSYIFTSIIHSIQKQEEQTKAIQTHRALRIADETLPYFRQGLTEESSHNVANIIQRYTGAIAVSLTNTKEILAHVGEATDHHIPRKSLVTGLSKKVIDTGQIMKAKSRIEIDCEHPDCTLQCAIVLPLISNFCTQGTLKMYFGRASDLTQAEVELAEGLAKLFSTQLELGEAERQTTLLQDAEIKSLQAQVNPHFFFNAINTISALCRTDVEKTRKLLIQLSKYFRSNLQGSRQLLIPLSNELDHIQAYLSLEQARFPHKYHIHFNIEELARVILLPPFSIQMLVENAVQHAFSNKQVTCEIEVRAKIETKKLFIEVQDNGRGISKTQVHVLGTKPVDSQRGTGTALYNVNQRLVGLFGDASSLNIQSKEQVGTVISFSVPLQQ